MRLHFRNRMFSYHSVLRFIVIFLFYVALTIVPHISGYYFEIVPRANPSAIISGFHEMLFLLTMFSVGVTALFSKFVGMLACFETFVYSREEILSIISLKITSFHKCYMDISNPFLYSSKTMGLLE